MVNVNINLPTDPEYKNVKCLSSEYINVKREYLDLVHKHDQEHEGSESKMHQTCHIRDLVT